MVYVIFVVGVIINILKNISLVNYTVVFQAYFH